MFAKVRGYMSIKTANTVQRSLESIRGENDSLKSRLGKLTADYELISSKVGEDAADTRRLNKLEKQNIHLKAENELMESKIEELEAEIKQLRSIVESASINKAINDGEAPCDVVNCDPANTDVIDGSVKVTETVEVSTLIEPQNT
jgi:predicted RNase H-like nuclease (RuvC/YqgF family)